MSAVVAGIEHLGDISRPDAVGRVEAARLGLRHPTVSHGDGDRNLGGRRAVLEEVVRRGHSLVTTI